MKLNNKILAIVLSVLVLILIYQKFIHKADNRSFKDVLLELESSDIDQFKLINRGIVSQLEKTEGGWILKGDNGDDYPVNSSAVGPLLDAARGVKTQQLVSRSADKHAEYELDAASGKLLECYSKGKLLGGLYAGRFNFDQARRAAKTYVREAGDSDIYSTEGFLAMSLDRKPDDFRIKEILPGLKPDELNKITLMEGGTTQTIEKTLDASWMDGESVMLDSISLSNYINALSSARGLDFVHRDSIDGALHSKLTLYSTRAEYNLEVYKNESGSFLIRNENNPNQSFRSDSTSLFKTVYLDLKALLSEV